ncbi:hypothetical protein [Dysosmobacter sp.]|uniref:hypothetical protein n=1 Tax=Dysosmobacter sp. TaxID=2591382 RepID=UPI002A89490C|nr:hypothetical protein [Dysosmobacter sp.]MDY3281267.1 hypothetical protein [Dysosmobacter sp.]
MKRKIRKRWLALAAVMVLCAAVLAWPVPFARYANTAEAEYMILLSRESGTSRSRSDLTPEELGQVLPLLENGRLRWRGFCRNIVYSGGETLYSFTLSHTENGTCVQDARFELLSDGTLYNVWYNVGYTRFRLEGVDMEALCRTLEGLLSGGGA